MRSRSIARAALKTARGEPSKETNAVVEIGLLGGTSTAARKSTSGEDGVISVTVMRSVALALALLVTLVTSFDARAQAAPAIERLVQNLRDSDFRVRTQAALALGASKNEQAVTPLCSALGDSSITVRTAVAAALGRLALGGSACLERRLSLEPAPNVKTAIARALELLAEPKIGPETRYYVAIAKLSDKSGRPPGELDQRVRAGIMSAARPLKTFAFAPATETPEQAKTRFKRHPSLKAFYLAPRLPAFEYQNSNLTIRIDIAMFTYPERALVGNYGVRLTQPDVEGRDVMSENDLVTMAAERALEKFAKLVPTL
jgi:hypothetical protein